MICSFKFQIQFIQYLQRFRHKFVVHSKREIYINYCFQNQPFPAASHCLFLSDFKTVCALIIGKHFISIVLEQKLKHMNIMNTALHLRLNISSTWGSITFMVACIELYNSFQKTSYKMFRYPSQCFSGRVRSLESYLL